MKKSVLTGVLAVVLVLFLAPGAMAYQIRAYQNAYSSGSGGEFGALTYGISFLGAYSPLTKDIPQYSGPQFGTFETFCLEHNETFSPGTLYNMGLSNKAIQGGIGPAGDPISKGTAWLYDQFARGVLANYFNANRQANAGALQNAIWALENEGGALNAYYQGLLIAQFGSVANAQVDANGAYGVMVMNITNLDGSLAQDMLVRVPEPATMLLLGFGLLGLTVAGRRRFMK